jgi:hypothetical protein
MDLTSVLWCDACVVIVAEAKRGASLELRVQSWHLVEWVKDEAVLL